MFNKNSVKTFCSNNSEFYNKMRKKYLNYDEQIAKFKEEYKAKYNTIYNNMADAIDSGLERSLNRLMDNIEVTDENTGISTVVKFNLSNLASMDAFFKIINDYSNEYMISVVDSNAGITFSDNVLDGENFKRWRESVNYLLDQFHINGKSTWTPAEVMYAYEHEHELFTKAVRQIYDKDVISISLGFVSKFSIKDVIEENEKSLNKAEKHLNETKKRLDNIFGDEFNCIFENIGKAFEDLFSVRAPRIRHNYNPFGTWTTVKTIREDQKK